MFNNIDAERARKGWTKKELAQKLDISAPTLRAWIRGSAEIPATKLLYMADLFNCSMDYLLKNYNQDKSIEAETAKLETKN